MDNIDLYIYSSIKGNVRKSGSYIYILELKTGKGPATLTGGPMPVEEVTGYQSELMAMIGGLKRLTRPCSINIHASNVTLIAALQNGWYKTWAENDYKNSKGEDISCVDEWKQFNESLGQSCIDNVVSDKHSYSSWMESECRKGDVNV